MGLTAATPVDVRVLARHLNIEVVPADQLIDIRKLQELIAEQDGPSPPPRFTSPVIA